MLCLLAHQMDQVDCILVAVVHHPMPSGSIDVNPMPQTPLLHLSVIHTQTDAVSRVVQIPVRRVVHGAIMRLFREEFSVLACTQG